MTGRLTREHRHDPAQGNAYDTRRGSLNAAGERCDHVSMCLHADVKSYGRFSR